MSKGSHGSPRHTESRGAGPVEGAGQYPARGPGRMMGGMPSDMYPSDKTPKGGNPKPIRGVEEDGS